MVKRSSYLIQLITKNNLIEMRLSLFHMQVNIETDLTARIGYEVLSHLYI